MATRIFLDCSGNAKSPYVTLAAFAATDEAWAEFEYGWKRILDSGFLPVPYMHMVEALGLRHKSPFSRSDGWTRRSIWNLIFRLVGYMKNIKGGKLQMFSCAINMNTWRELDREGSRLPSETSICNRCVSEYIVARFAENVLRKSEDKEIITLRHGDLLNFVFDRGERFCKPFAAFVDSEKDRAGSAGHNAIWQLVDGISEGEMKRSPGLQAADMLAWGTNRENTAPQGSEGTRLAFIMRQLVVASWKEYDESTLRREFGASSPRFWPNPDHSHSA